MRKRIVAFVMAVVVAFGCVGYRPQKAYASEMVMAGEALEVFFGLLGASGMIVGFEKPIQQRQAEAQKLFDSFSASEQTAFWDWYSVGNFVSSDTGHRVYQPSMSVDTSFYRDFWNSVTGIVDSHPTVDLPLGDFTRIDGLGLNVPKTTFATGLVSDSSYFVAFRGGHYDVVYCIASEGMAVSCTVDINGSVSSIKKRYVDFIQLDIEGGKGTNPDAVLGSISYSYAGTTRSFGFGGFVISDDISNGIRFKNGEKVYGRGVCSTDVLSVLDGPLVGMNDLIDCDTWVSKWDDAVTEKKQVGITVGQDLSNYDTVADIYNPDTGIVSGLDGVLDPTIPTTPDLTGISGFLQKILNLLKGLAVAIGVAVVGTGTLDFSKFNEIKLSGLFPFCIPFDLINVFKSFNGVQPIEPKWTIDLAGTPLKAGGKIELDLTQFGVWISIIRYFCYASFVVGLIVITRKVIKG